MSAPACKRPIGFGEDEGEGDGETWRNMAKHGQSWPIMANHGRPNDGRRSRWNRDCTAWLDVRQRVPSRAAVLTPKREA
ncbi:MAG: hypothetical protein DWI09_03625 [Planctomycetota bacterium]|nr:MAG: hypothetical protein DWI09_03625 [Planctomycetota bacterium]